MLHGILTAGVAGVGALLLGLFLYVANYARRDLTPRAARRALGLALLLPAPFFLATLPFPGQPLAAAALLAVAAGIATLLFLPMGRVRVTENETPAGRFDERDLVFARARLFPGHPAFDDYYARHPERRETDDKFRASPGLFGRNGKMYHHFLHASIWGTMRGMAGLYREIDGKVWPREEVPNAEDMTRFVKEWTRHIGALDVGVTRLQEYHLYTHRGYRNRHGEPIEKEHEWAIAFTVEMDREMTRRGPRAPGWLEAGKQYEITTNIAVQLAAFIRRLGYPARAHVFENYEVIAPLVARDAGLGEIGRIDILMTPRLGPRVRLAVVTTDLPLVPDQRARDGSVLDFCMHCTKCADACPAKALPFGERTAEDGVMRWRMDAEACFAYWMKTAAPCGRCMAVCPYGHEDNPVNNLVRFAVRRSPVARRCALKMDDYLYGRIPKPLKALDWMNVRSERVDISK